MIEATQLYYLSKRLVTATTRCTVDHFDIHLVLPDYSAINVSIPFKHIIQSMLVKPVLLSSFLLEIIMSRFSYDSIQWVLNRVDLHLPGEGEGVMNHSGRDIVRGQRDEEVGRGRDGDDGMMQKALHHRTAETLPFLYHETPTEGEASAGVQGLQGQGQGLVWPKGGSSSFWRQSMWSEVTVASYAYTTGRALRGPRNTFHSFVSGQYCSVRINVTAIGDISLTLAPPYNGKFEGYSMQGQGQGGKETPPPLEIFITREDLLVFIAKSCVKNNSFLSPYFLCNIDILLPSHQEALHSFLLSSIVIHKNNNSDKSLSSHQSIGDIEDLLLYSDQEEYKFKKTGYDEDVYSVVAPSMIPLKDEGK